MLDVSRECIHDTLMVKRNYGKKAAHFSIYRAAISRVREQLSRSAPQKMRVNRFLDEQKEKRSAPFIIVTLSGGLVSSVHSTNKYTQVEVLDYDVDDMDRDFTLEDELEERKKDMHQVW